MRGQHCPRTRTSESGSEDEAIRQKPLLIDTPSFARADGISAIREKLKRVGVIDIGSNSVRLVVFDGAARSPAYFFNEKVLCGLGRGVPETGLLHPEGRAAAMASIRRFVAMGAYMRLTALSAVATAAVREATDGPDFVAEIARETGLKVMVATGREEATLSAQGVLLGWPGAEGLVCDIGGSSMELADLRRGKIMAAETSPLGPLTLQSWAPEERDAQIGRVLTELRQKFPNKVKRLFLVGGSWRAIAGLDMARRDYPLHVLHDYRMTPADARETAEWAQEQTIDQLSERLPSTSRQRLSLVPDAARVLSQLIPAFDPDNITISSYGIREGLLYAHMPKNVRRLDPLTEAARHMESAAARFPRFGDALYAWLKPVFGTDKREQRRIIRAACLLHDVSWRAHPDYRAEVCFESVTRANLGGLNHRERVFLGVVLLNRYKGSATTAHLDPIISLLPEDELKAAATLGKALRLGAMISGGSKRLLAETSLSLIDDKLVLGLQQPAHVHVSEVVEKRLAALAAGLGVDAVIRKYD